MLFSRWGAFVYRFRRPIALATSPSPSRQRSSARNVTERPDGRRLDRPELRIRGGQHPPGRRVRGRPRLARRALPGPAGHRRAFGRRASRSIATSLARLAAEPLVDGSSASPRPATTGSSAPTARSAYVVVRLTITDEQSVDEMDTLRGLIDPPAGMTYKLAGVGPFTQDQAHQSEMELVQAETVSAPFVLLILLAVFASVVAAGLPLLVAALTIPTTFGGLFLVAQVTDLSIYVQNVATMLGLALAIDYSLFMVSRFREELRRGRTVAQAVETTVATSGKAVAFSGLAVAIGLSGLLLFRPTALRSFGIGGSLVVASSVFFALTFLPAVLGMLGPRVNALSLGGLFDAIRRRLGRPVGDRRRAPRDARAGPASPMPSWPGRSRS